MQIQKRLTLGIGVLFAMILLLGIQSVGYIRDLSKASVNIIADNYNSLRYASDMMTSLDSIEYDSAAMLPLLETLALQQKNITEADEFQATGALQQRIAMLQDTVTPRTIQLVRSDLYRIMELNMAAIQAKSRLLSDASEEAMWWLAITAVLCVLIAFVFLVRFPRGVVKPITMLKEGILEIANFNYDKRLDFKHNKEFKAVAESFNKMAEKLSEYRRSTVEDLMTNKKRIEAIVNSLHEPIIGLDPDKKILFMNNEAFTILNLKPIDVIGKNAAEVALGNDLLRRLIRSLFVRKGRRAAQNLCR